jgi:hypothetical protein
MKIHNLVSFTLTALITLPSMAECYQESSTVNQAKSTITEITDHQKFVKTAGNHQICTVIFKAKINNKWHDARAESQGNISDSTDQLCSKAMHLGQIKILEKIGGTTIQGSQTLYCNDFDIPQLRTGLKKNDKFRVSELKPMPNAQLFQYRGSICRYFLESDLDMTTNDLMQWQIVGCIIRDEWVVVDKF